MLKKNSRIQDNLKYHKLQVILRFPAQKIMSYSYLMYTSNNFTKENENC